ncbi:MAG: non-homologous end-joining DNA ligase [Syntrophomonadaceae bacterium]|jgi:bifunctional non-homologous end joining protein LigD
MITKKQAATLNGRELTLSNLDKVLWPGQGYTKGDLIKYYVEVSPYIIKHLRNRPLVITRYPNGIKGKSFYQKNAPEYMPEWIKTFPWYSQDSKRYIYFILVEEAATMAWLANQAGIEMHPWLSSKETVDYPDFVVFDLDPSPGSTYQDVIDIAMALKELLDSLELRSYVKSSGAEGLHIYVPVINKYTYQEIRKFAQAVAEVVTRLLPKIATVERLTAKRGSKVYVDYLQNALGKTLCSPYSVRPRENAPVSAPLYWNEVEQSAPAYYNIKNIMPRIEKVGDLFAPVLSDKQDLDQAIARLLRT